jgi:hypothetical protein
MSTPAPTTTPRRGIRFLAAALAALLTAATLSLTAVAPAQAATPPVLTHDLVVGQDVGFIEFAAKDTYFGTGWDGDRFIPPGLSRDLTAEHGFGLIGTPTQAGIFTLGIAIKHEADGPWVDYRITFRIADTPTWVTPPTLPSGEVNVPYELDLEVTPFATFSVNPAVMPPGLTLNAKGEIRGTPTTPGVWFVSITAGNAAGQSQRFFALNIAPGVPAPTWNPGAALPPLRAGDPVDVNLAVSAINATSFEVTAGALPAGLTLTGGTRITGAPPIVGTNSTAYSFTLDAIGQGGRTAKTFTGAVLPPLPVWNTTTIGPITVGQPFELQLDATYATGFVEVGDVLPPGLTLDQNGLLKGTPTSVGSWPTHISAYNPGGETRAPFTIVVANPAPVWQTTSLPDLWAGTSVNTTLTASHAIAYELVAGAVPDGLTVEGNVISGIPTSTSTGAIPYSFTVRAFGLSTSTDQVFSGIVRPPTPVWITDKVGPMVVGVPFQQQLEADFVNGFVVVGGSIPPGISVHRDGRVDGTPTALGSYTLMIVAGNEYIGRPKSFTIEVTRPAPVWETTALPPLEVGVAMTATDLEATDATSFAVTAGALPAGLELDGATISGTPTAPFGYSFTITATGPGGTTAQAFTGNVLPGKVLWQTESIGPFVLGEQVDVQLSASYATYYDVHLGTLPPGLALSGSGQLTGSPITTGTWSPTLVAGNQRGGQIKSFPIAVNLPAPVWQTDALPFLQVDAAVNVPLEATNTESFRLVDGELPAGLSLEGRAITGTPTTFESYDFTLEAEGPQGSVTQQHFSGFVYEGSPAWITESIGPFTIGEPVDTRIEVKYATSYRVTAGAFPAGLVLAADGSLTGTPTEVGTTSVTVVGSHTTDAAPARTFDVEVLGEPVWVTESLDELRQGVAFEEALEVTDATEFTVSAGELPAGLTLAEDGTLEGTPQASGPYDVTIAASNGDVERTKRFTGAVLAPKVVWVTSQVGPFTVGDEVDVQLEATHAESYVLWGTLPAGLTLEPSGRVHGTVTESGSFSYTVEARNANGLGSSKGLLTSVLAVPAWVGETSLLLTTGDEQSVPNASVANGSFKSATVEPAGIVTAEVRGRFGLVLTAIAAGTATVTVTYTNSLRDWTQELQIEVRNAPVWVTESLDDLREGVAFQQTVEATDATGYRVSAGTLPAGLTLAADGAISGTPGAHGPYDVTIAATNGDVETTQRFTGAVAAPLVVWQTAPALPSITAGGTVDVSLAATNATTFELTDGALPDGVTLDEGRLSGATTAAGDFTFEITARNADGTGAAREFTLDVVAKAVWSGDTSFLLTSGNQLRVPASAITGGALITATVTPSEVVTVNAGRGGLLITGLQAGTATVTVTFGNGVDEWTQDLAIEVRDAPVWTTTELTELREGVAFQQALQATDATGFRVSAGDLPIGLELAEDGTISGTPATYGPYAFTVAATNGDTEVEHEFTGEVSAAFVVWTTESFPVLDRNVAAELPLELTNATEVELSDGELPPGIELVEGDGSTRRAADPVWALTGTPTDSGTSAFELTARNATGDTESRAFEIVVEQPELTLTFAGEPGDQAAGVEVGADGSGLAPATGFSVVLHSDPVELAAGEASADGTIAASTTLPASVPFGAHELRFTATGADGAHVATSVWFSVDEAGRIVEVSTSGPVAEPERAPVPAPTPAPAPAATDSDHAIAATGTDVGGWLGAALALVLAGLAGLVIARRRRSAPTS